MAKAEMVFQFIENGSNSMTTFQALMSAANSPNDSLSLMQNGTNVVATITNVTSMLQPIRIQTNLMNATSALIRVVADWKDPKKGSDKRRTDYYQRCWNSRIYSACFG
jgi:hypothetical protein